MSTMRHSIKRILLSLFITLLLSLVFFSLKPPTAVYAQSGSIAGTVYYDEAGTAITNTFTTFATPAHVTLFDDRYRVVISTTTDANGNFMFTGLLDRYYYVAVDNTDELAGFSDGEGAGAVDQTYGSSGTATTGSGPICAGNSTDYVPQNNATPSRWLVNAQNKTRQGPCYGGRDSSIPNDPGTDLALKKHVIKVRLISTNNVVTGLTFAFSHNVVNNLQGSGPGSLRMFLRAANSLSGTHTMRFVPVVAPNMTSSTNTWWRMVYTGTALMPTITGQSILVDGHAYKYRDGTTLLDTNKGNVVGAMTVGMDNIAVAAIARPELEIFEDLSTNQATLEVQGDNITIRNLAFNVHDNMGSSSYHIRQSAGTALLVEDIVMGYDMVTNSMATNRTYYGITTAYATPTTSTGTYRHNYIASNLTSILLSNSAAGSGNVVAGTLGDWTLEKNVINGGIRLGAGTDRILIRYNKSDEAIIMAQSQGVNSAVGNNTISGNTLTSSSGDIIRIFETDGNIITHNKLQNATSGSAVSITAGGSGNRITQNAFGNNSSNAIDLGDNGVTAATGCTDAGAANGGLGRPVITKAALLGNLLTTSATFCNSGAFDLELYKAAVGAGEGIPAAGEGALYLGTLTNVSGGSISNGVITVPVTVGLSIGDNVTMLAIDRANGNTSEFSANYDLSLSISGKVFHDVAGTASATGPAFVGSTTADLHLYDTFGNHLKSTTLDSSGNFTFTGLTNGVYYVTINEFRGLATGAVGAGAMLLEQTYGSTGDGASGSGPICTGAAPNYVEQTSPSAPDWVPGAQNGNPTAGPCYGGRSSNSSTASAAAEPAVGLSEHAMRIVISNKSVTGVAFGFSANVVTNLGAGAGQGTLPTFLTLANALSGANTMRFVPVVKPNQINGANQWWRVALSSALPQITDNSTTINGVAYSNVDGATVRDTNTALLGYTGAVGLGADGRAATGDEASLAGASGPELEITPAGTIDYGFDINANSITIQSVAIYGFGNTTTLPTGANNFGDTGNIIIRNGKSGITVTHNLLGSVANSFTDPGASRTKGSNIIFDAAADQVVISYNLIGFAADSGILKYGETGAGALTKLTIANNEIRGNGKAPAVDTQGAGIELNNTALPGASQNVTIAQNLIAENGAQGIQLNYGRGITIDGNSISSNGGGATNRTLSVDERQNVQVAGGQEITVQHNTMTDSVAGDGIALRTGPGGGNAAATRIRISQNAFGSNRGQALNLVPDGVNPNNGNCQESNQQNLLVDYPVITLAEIVGTSLKITGSTCNNLAGAVEIYKVAANSGQGETLSNEIYGEGGAFLGSFAVTGGAFATQTLTGIHNLVAGEYVTALFIDANGNTSEFSKNAYVYSPVTLSVTPSVGEGKHGTITATLSVTSLNPVQVTLAYINGTAGSQDYSGQSTLTIPANTLSATGSFTITDDATVEGDETFQINVAAVQNATNAATPQTVTIIDNDLTAVTLSATPSLVEGITGTITATLTTTNVKAINITLVYTDVSTASDDYIAQTTLVVPGGQRKATIPFVAKADAQHELTETLQVAIIAIQGGANAATPQTITILNDTDHDLIADGKDSDDDGDGITDGVEGNGLRDSDSDGIADSLDTDSDNDRIPDAIEGHDANGDGQPDRAFSQVDADHDGLDDAFDTSMGGVAAVLPDSDLDATPNYLDRDDDNDGENTDVEDANGDGDNNPATQATDADQDRIPDYLDPDDSTTDGSGGDSDHDGLSDTFEYDANGDTQGPDNTDGDGLPDYLDPDDDNDGVPTALENADPNGDHTAADAQDTDKDNIPDYRDNNDDNDDLLTAAEDANGDADGNPATNPTDADGDRIPDYLDPDDNTTGQQGGDSDHDGLRDFYEYDINNDNIMADDSDGDGKPNYLDDDDDNDGLPTIQEKADINGDGNPEDAAQSDNDSVVDYLDSDSDNDGLFDGAEYDVDSNGSGPDDSDGDGKSDYRDDDDDNDTILTALENADPNGNHLPDDAVNTDGDALPDYLDNDDDNDNKLTALEVNTDADGDHIPDNVDPDDTSTDGSGGDSDTDGVNDASEFGGGATQALVNSAAALDTDGDGKPNYWDNDDDNDGIPTAQEHPDANGDGNAADARDTDGDKTPDYLDNDDDNDNKLTLDEGTGDTDGDHIANYLDPDDSTTDGTGGDSDKDGLNDVSEFDINQDNQGPDDSDGDGLANYFDADDDGDSVPTSAENADANGDGNPADARDTDGDTIPDYLDANNTDGLQADNDGDGILTGNEDLNGDGNIYNDDSDGDGTPNYLDNDDDNDSVLTKDEDVNGNGNRADDDTDGDKTPNYLDNDDDGDLIPTKSEDINKDGNPANDDSDGDKTPNYLDNDDDNDGILTRDEDANHDGDPTNDDADKDGTPDYLDTDSTADFDGDGLPNNIDLDDDNDSVSDVDEGNGTIDTDGDKAPDTLDMDDDNDGVPTKDEDINGNGNPADDDTDGDSKPNYLDTDDDGDGIASKAEDLNGNGNPTDDDTDGDKTPNYLDNDDDGDGVLTKVDNTGYDPADTNLNDDDTDGDGLPNYLDADDDGDTVPTSKEDLNHDGDMSNDDTDGDGIANALDDDDDGDGILTKLEDLNGDGDPTNDDSNGNGIPDYLDTDSIQISYRVLLPFVSQK
ncbi:MAG: hypothetical protein R3C14_24865 [Caldilineaceae bacterium]